MVLTEYKEQLACEFKTYIELEHAIKSTVDKLPTPYLQIVYYYYFDGERLVDIAERMHFSEQHIRRLHKIALYKLEEILANS